jgi:prepilin signal peptidase PulO-like enzyme (type II secretory pathway)
MLSSIDIIPDLALLREDHNAFRAERHLNGMSLSRFLVFWHSAADAPNAKSTISWQYPLVELITGCAFAGLYLLFGVTVGLFYSFIAASLFIVIFVYDIRHKIIPDGLVAALGLLSLIPLFVTVLPATIQITFPSLTALLAGPVLAAPFALLWLVSGGRWMGLGDAKLALPLGWFLGMSAGISAVIIAFWAGAIIGILILIIQKINSSTIHRLLLSLHLGGITMKSEIPFAPFLIFGFVVVFFSGLDVLHLGNLLGL